MSVEMEELVDRPAMHPVLRAVRRALEVTFAEPVSNGRPIPSRWPAGMAVVGWTTGALVVVLGAVSVFAGLLRAHFPFTASQASNRSIPEILLPLFVAVVIWTLALAHCALIRLAWYIKLPALAVTISGMAALGLFSSGRVLVLAVAAISYLAVIIIVFARRRAPYRWWEFPLITTLIAISWLVELLAPAVGAQIAYDARLLGIEQELDSFSSVAMPALIAAGVAPALITVSAAEAIAVRPVPRILTTLGVVAVIAWRIVTTIQTVAGDTVEQGSEAVLASVMTLGLTALALILVWRLAPRPEVVRPGELPELWTAWSFPVAVALVGAVALMVPISTIYLFWTAFHLPGESVASWIYGVAQAVNSTWWRAVPGTALGIGAIFLARRGRIGEASLLAAVCVYMVTGAIGTVLPPGMLRARTPDAIAAITSWLAIVVLIVSFLARRLTRQRLVGLLTVLLVGGLYTYRNALDDPVSAIFGYAGLGIALFGLIWQAITGAGFTRKGSKRFPEPTRIFAYLANTLFAFAVVAFVSTTRVQVGGIALADLESTGDAALGTPLLLAATVLGLWYGFGAEEHGESD
jgi:hypothetical protein